MAKVSKRILRAQIREHARQAKLLLPPTPENCPAYTRQYFESYRSKLFAACRNAHHRQCPQTAEQGPNHWYCKCPCHRTDLTRSKKRRLLEAMKQEARTQERKRSVRDPNAVRQPRAAVGTRGQKKTFRYVHAPKERIPAGIMHIVHAAIAGAKQGTVAEIAAIAIANGLEKVTGQDPTNQTSVMLHRMLKAGVVEVL